MSPSATSNGHPGPKHEKEEFISSNLSTSALENKLRQLREESNQLNQELTQKLASSQSGQNLLHIGSSLSTLPPDLHSLLTQLHPVLSASELFEKQNLQDLHRLTDAVTEIRTQQQRSLHASECADLYADLTAAESKVQSSRYAFDNDVAHAKQRNGNGTVGFAQEERHEDHDDDEDDDNQGGDRIGGKSDRSWRVSTVPCDQFIVGFTVTHTHSSLSSYSTLVYFLDNELIIYEQRSSITLRLWNVPHTLRSVWWKTCNRQQPR